jgi:hypothetical protein
LSGKGGINSIPPCINSTWGVYPSLPDKASSRLRFASGNQFPVDANFWELHVAVRLANHLAMIRIHCICYNSTNTNSNLLFTFISARKPIR